MSHDGIGGRKPPPADHSARARERVVRYRELPVGWAALAIIAASIVAAIVVTVTKVADGSIAAFGAAVALTGTMLGLGAWDLFVGLLARRDAPNLALPHRITLGLRPGVVPFLSPAAFFLGILIAHFFWG